MKHDHAIMREAATVLTAPTLGRRIWRFVAVPLLCLCNLLAFVCFFAARWYIATYGNTGFDSILFTLTGGLGGVNPGLVSSFLLKGALPALLCCAAVNFALFFPWKKYLPREKFAKFRQIQWTKVISAILSLSLSAGLLIHAANFSGLADYLHAINSISALFENEYKDPNTVNITFPEEKRNVIYIILESMETSYLSQEQGGAMEQNLIPELTQLAENNINFSHNTSVGGFREVSGSSWTVGSLVAQTSGVPLKVPSDIKDWQNGYGKEGVFLPGLNTLFNVLQEQGYYQSLMVGSAAYFGGRDTYYKTHGVDKIYDLFTARKDGTVDRNYWNDWWGFEDYILFDYAKKELTEISQKGQPFFFSMLTVDTHHIGGFNCIYCDNTYDETYENAIACSSRQVAAFVEWIQQQPYYENTTIVITGDHYSMDHEYFKRTVETGYQRHVYNCFINAATEPTRTENRNFCALDMFPTTLAAMGCTIEGDRLGLGTNLFSNTPTLIETVGYTAFNYELSKTSDYYKDNFYTEKD